MFEVSLHTALCEQPLLESVFVVTTVNVSPLKFSGIQEGCPGAG
jgi:hypothetical protein